MEYVNLGSTGLKVSRLCIGCLSFGGGGKSGIDQWGLGYEESEAIIKRAFDLGINFFDTADTYSFGKSEEFLGKAIEGRRNDLIISTKTGLPIGAGPNDTGLSRKHIRHAVAESLQRLRTKFIDLYLVHRWDYDTRIGLVLQTLDDLVHQDGIVNYTGASSMWAWQFAKALYTSDRLGLEKFAVMQNHYSLVYREEEREMIPLCNDQGVALIAWSPLAKGFLSGKYTRGGEHHGSRYDKDEILRNRYFTENNFDILERVKQIASAKGCSPAQIALSWVLHKREYSSAVVSFTNIRQLDEMAEAVSLKLRDDEIKVLEDPYRPHSVQGFA